MLIFYFLDYRLTYGLTDISCRCIRSIYTACFVVWWPRRAADTSTNRRQGFLCRRSASMEQAADRAEVTAVDHYFSSSTENIFVPICPRTPERLMIVLWCALGLQYRGQHTNDSYSYSYSYKPNQGMVWKMLQDTLVILTAARSLKLSITARLNNPTKHCCTVIGGNPASNSLIYQVPRET